MFLQFFSYLFLMEKKISAGMAFRLYYIPANDVNELMDSNSKEPSLTEMHEQVATVKAVTSDPDPPEKQMAIASMTKGLDHE
ncbi:hypothetical protein AVEN_70837-1 [Araneus ventricosus]|uniref:Uncharacterized protein n=1 Tax=Araneus ventricosus TaxID=182803 RepID=A0A4Y2HIP2_ARAVE|nr:hypothetical protein AVEN_70837-1 [Araneus ventricosus]